VRRKKRALLLGGDPRGFSEKERTRGRRRGKKRRFVAYWSLSSKNGRGGGAGERENLEGALQKLLRIYITLNRKKKRSKA